MVLVTALPIQSAFSEGGARRDAVRQEQSIADAIKHATEAMEHGKQGHTEKLVTHAEASLQQAQRGSTGPHMAEAVTNLKAAIEHGKAGHTDVATQHTERAITHLSQAR